VTRIIVSRLLAGSERLPGGGRGGGKNYSYATDQDENKETAVTDLAVHPLLVAAHAVARIHHYVLAGIVDAALVAAYLTGLRQHPPLHQAQ